MEWLNNFLEFASGTAAAGPPIKASGERYSSVSCHLAMALHDALRDGESGIAAWLASLASRAGHVDVATARDALSELVEGAPFMCRASAFQAPNGLFDLPQILATAHYGTTAPYGFVPEYKRLLQRLNWLMMTIASEWVRNNADPTVLELVEIIRSARVGDYELPERLRKRLVAMGRDLMPTPISVVAAIGVDYEAPTDQPAFANFVAGIHAELVAQTGLTVLTADSSPQAQYLVHMRRFLSETAERLPMAVMPCDRAPVVSPWYASMVLGTRGYAHALAKQLAADRGKAVDTRERFTLFSLMTLADEGLEDELHGELADELAVHGLQPVTSLFSSRTKSMYVPLGAQEGSWWLLLRATLSGMTVAEADLTAKMLVESAAGAPEAARNAVMLCVLMHTQSAMRIVGYRPPDADLKWPRDLPVAALIRRRVDPVCRQTALDILATTTSGTLDLESLASDDLAFNRAAQPRMAHAWMVYLNACCYEVEMGEEPASDDSHVAGTVRGFCDALKAIGMDWIDVCLDKETERNADPAPPVDESIAASPDEMRDSLMRAAAASATINCAPWLGVVFELSWKLERRWRGDDERPLIRSPLKMDRDTGVLEIDVLKDEAWLRLHFCYLAEQALHSARNGGLWSAGNHLVLVAWLSTDRRHADDHEKDHGVRMFARAITSHTVRATEPNSEEARLITPTWQRAVTRSGWDSVVECARRFERELHSCTSRIHTAHADRMREVQSEWQRQVASDEAGATDGMPAVLPDLPTPPTPVVHKRSIDRAHAAAVACGPGRFEKESIPGLDAATGAAMARFRARCNQEAVQRTLLTCSTEFAHGACVAVLAMRSNEDDIRYARETERRGRLPGKRVEEQANLLARITKFSAMGGGS